MACAEARYAWRYGSAAAAGAGGDGAAEGASDDGGWEVVGGRWERLDGPGHVAAAAPGSAAHDKEGAAVAAAAGAEAVGVLAAA